MSVVVQIPIRLRVNAAALADEAADVLSEAVTKALHRALENSRALVLESRGGYQTVRLAEPSFAWLGAGRSAISERTRLQLEQQITVWIEQSAQGAGLFDFAQDHHRAPQPLPPIVRESADPQRYEPLFDLYELPSYDNGKKITVPVKSKKRKQTSTPIKRHHWTPINRGSRADKWLDLDIESDASLYDSMLNDAIYYWGKGPTTDQEGLLWYQTNNRYGFLFKNYEADRWWSYILPNLITSEWDGKKWVDVDSNIPIGIAHIRVFATASSLTELQDKALLMWGDEIRTALTTAAQNAKMTISQAAIESMVQHEVNRRVTAWNPDFPVAIIELQVGSDKIHFKLKPEGLWTGTAQLLPVTSISTVKKDPKKKKKGKQPPVGDSDGSDTGKVPSQQKGKGEGTGEKDGTGAGDGAKTGEGTGADGSGGPVVVFDDPDATSPQGRVYPLVQRSGTEGYSCESFEGEPSVYELGENGRLLEALITEIAARLQMAPCEFAAQFLLMAAQAIASRARDVADFAAQSKSAQMGFTRPAQSGQGNLGNLEFRPTSSPAIQFLSFLAQVVPLLTRLSNAVDEIYKASFEAFSDDRPHSFNRWWIDLHYRVNGEISEAVGTIFVAGCRVLLLQLLRSSAQQIAKRIQVFPEYAPLFERLVLTQLIDVDDLKTLHRRLSEKLHPSSMTQKAAQAVVVTWRETHHRLGELLSPKENATGTVPEAASEFVAIGTSYGIRDKTGHVWTIDELTAAIEIRQNTAVAIDPLVQQLTDIPHIRARLQQDTGAIRVELQRLLIEMMQSNQKITHEVENDFYAAFRMGKIQDDLPGGTFGWGYELQGIHLQVHELLSEFFEGDSNYKSGVYWLFRHEESRKETIEFVTFAGVTLLSILCPPLGVAVGIGTAIYTRHEAKEKEALFRSLVDPTEVISWADVEAELFAAELGLALSFIPVAGKVLKVATGSVTTVVREGVRGSARATVTAARRTLTREGARALAGTIRQRFTLEMAEQLKHGLLVALAKEIIEDQLMDLVIGKLVFEPIVEAIYREYGMMPEPPTGEH